MGLVWISMNIGIGLVTDLDSNESMIIHVYIYRFIFLIVLPPNIRIVGPARIGDIQTWPC